MHLAYRLEVVGHAPPIDPGFLPAQRLLRHARPETTLGSYDITGEALERHASHHVAGVYADNPIPAEVALADGTIDVVAG